MRLNTLVLNAIFMVLLLWIKLNCVESRRGAGSVRGFCPSGLYATDVTAKSAVLHWRDVDEGPITVHVGKIVECEVHCAGLRHYSTSDGSSELDSDAVTHYVPEGQDHVLLGRLHSNFNYTCTVTAETTTGTLATSVPYAFATGYQAPEAPQTPQMETLENGPGLEIKLFPTSSKYGPISGYEVQFHVVKNPATAHDIPAQFLKPKGPIASAEAAEKSPDPLSFRFSYTDYELPQKITSTDGLLNGAMKDGTIYSVLMVAYSRTAHTDNLDSRSFLYTSSAPSSPFVASGEARPKRETLKDRPLQAALTIVAGVIIPSVVLLYISFVGIMIACLEYQKWLAKSIKKVARNKTVRRKHKKVKCKKEKKAKKNKKKASKSENPKNGKNAEIVETGTNTVNGDEQQSCSPNRGYVTIPRPPRWTREPSDENLIEGIGVTRTRKGKGKAVAPGGKYKYVPKVPKQRVEVETDKENSGLVEELAAETERKNEQVAINIEELYAIESGTGVIDSDSDDEVARVIEVVVTIEEGELAKADAREAAAAAAAMKSAREQMPELGEKVAVATVECNKSEITEVKETVDTTENTHGREMAAMTTCIMKAEESENVALKEVTILKGSAPNLGEGKGTIAMLTVEAKGSENAEANEATVAIESTQELGPVEEGSEHIAIWFDDEEDIPILGLEEKESEVVSMKEMVEQEESDHEATTANTITSSSQIDLSASTSEVETKTESLKATVSSAMFLPRGLSSGPFPVQSPNAIQNFNAQLSFESEMSDQAPELEMEEDVFGLAHFFTD